MKPLIDGKYYITLCGRVFVKERKELLTGRHPKPYLRTYPEKELKTFRAKKGYVSVGLTIEGNRVCRNVHRLVASSFIPNPENLPEVNHKNANKWDNRVSNLEWVSRKGNLLHAEKLGLKRIGSKVGTSVLDEEQVLEIVKLLGEGYTQTQVAEIYGVTNHAIHRIAKGHNWSWLTGIGRKVGEQCVH